MWNLSEPAPRFRVAATTVAHDSQSPSPYRSGDRPSCLATLVSASAGVGVGAKPLPGGGVFRRNPEDVGRKVDLLGGTRIQVLTADQMEDCAGSVDGGTVLMTDDPAAAGGKYGAADVVTKKLFRDFRLHIEFLIMKPGGNSGVYLQNRYEIQVLDGDRPSTGWGPSSMNPTVPTTPITRSGNGTPRHHVPGGPVSGTARWSKADATMYFNGKKVHLNQKISQVWGSPNSRIDSGNDGNKGITDVPAGRPQAAV